MMLSVDASVAVPTHGEGSSVSSPPACPRVADIHAVLSGVLPLEIYFQPIVDLHRGRTAGYEALARFPSSFACVGPDSWFALADEVGLGAALEGLALRRAMARRADMPRDCFLSVNVSPHLLGALEIQEALAGDLRGVVVELTEHVGNGDEHLLLESLKALRARGAIVALDDAGSGYAGLRQVAVVRPGLVKLDRSLVDGVDRDPVKRVLARLLGSFAGELDAWLLAEGIETNEELQVFLTLGVALGQGYFLGRPSPVFEPLDPHLGARIAATAALVRARHKVASLVTPVAVRRLDDVSTALLPRVVLDDTDRPIGLELANRPSSPDGGVMTVHPGDAVADATARAMSRPEARRWDPVVMTGARGQVLGLVLIDSLVQRLAELQQATERDDNTVSTPDRRGEGSEEIRVW